MQGYYRGHKFWVELGQYAGGGTSGGWQSSSDRCFHQVVQAPNSVVAESMIMGQYGGPERCRIIFQGYED